MPQQTINATSSPVLARNPGRLSLTLKNKSAGGQVIYFSLTDEKGLTIADADYVLEVNEEKNFTYELDGEDMRNPVAAVASAAGGVLYATDTSTRRGE
jgi:hypothetical protein